MIKSSVNPKPGRLSLHTIAKVSGVTVGALMLGLTVTQSPTWALGVAVLVVAAAVSLRLPAFALAAVLPATYGTSRLGPSAANLSVADGVLLFGAVAGIAFVPWHSPRLRRVLIGLVAYETMLALAVLAHPTARAVVEWGHRILLVGGSLVVGAALARLGSYQLPLRFYLAASATIAVAAFSYSVAHNFGPAAYPFGIQKNDAGLLLGIALLIAIIAPRSAALPQRIIGPLRVMLVLGLLATQSRGAMIATIAALAALQLRGRTARRAAPIVLVAVLAMGAVVATVTLREAARTRRDPSGASFYGLGARTTTDHQALAIWSGSRLFGAGLRYFRDPAFGTSEPHNVLLVTLAESGVVGIAALLALLISSWSSLRGLTGELATLARVAFAVRLLAAMVDIFWVAGRGSIPWILIGMAVGANAVATSPGPSPVLYHRA